MRVGIAKEKVLCNLCGADNYRSIAAGTDREYPTTSDVFEVVECKSCGLWYLNPRPQVAELATIYPDNYHAYNIRPAGAAPEKLSPITRLRHRIYTRRLRRALGFLKGQDAFDLLDVGCGDGWMLDLYRLAGDGKVRTFGVDFNREVCDVAASLGHTVYCGRFEDIQMDRQFDYVTLNHVIEHVSDPVAVARKSFEVLRPGGLFVLETPNTDTFDCRVFQSGNWGAYHIPRHWNLYNPQTIERLGETAGFRLEALFFNPAPVHWVWSFHNLSLQSGGWLGRRGQRLFAPLDVFSGTLKAFFLLAGGTVLDMVTRTVTGRTSNMMAIFRKP